MGFNENRFLSPLFKLFGKRLASVPPNPVDGDIIIFDIATNSWILGAQSGGGQDNTSSNVGSGDGLALPKVGVDLPFKTLVDGVEIVITVSAQELTFSIGAIAISKITGLQVELDSKIETLTNVGGEKEIAKAKVGQNVDLRTLKDGTKITITQNADDLEITADNQENTGTNLGAGRNVFKQIVGLDFEFRTLVQNAEVLISATATEILFSIGAIAQSKITGLVTALASKIETITNVGGFNEFIKAKVGTNVDVRTLQAGTNITIVQNADDIEISSTDTGEVNTASNVGTGVNVFLQKLLQDLEFRTLLANAEILITQNALDLAFSIGAIAQSKITGLVTALASKIETITNVGTGSLIAKAKVGTNVDLRSIIGTAPIVATQNADDITISLAGGAFPPSYLIMCFAKEITNGLDFLNLVGLESESTDETERQNVMPNAGTLERLTFVITDQKDEAQTITLRKNGADGNQSLTIPASTTGTFQDLVNTDSFVSGDLFSYELDISGAGTFEIASSAIEVTA